MNPLFIVLIYLAAISLVSAAVALYDKYAAKKRPRHRVPEIVLFCLAALGGSAAMYCTMLLIRHKTKHKRFMIGLPLIIVLHVLIGFVMAMYFLQP